MANSITTNATFATANMKPVPDEQIDALWGQNVGDNCGNLFYKEEVAPAISQSTGSAVFFFTKRPGKSGFKTLSYTAGAGLNDWYLRFMTDGGGTALVATKASVTGVAGSFFRFDVDISSLTNHTPYFVRLTYNTNGGGAAAWQTHGSGAGY